MKTKQLTGFPETCTARELGEFLAMSDRSVRHWAERGVIVRDGPGRYRTVESIQAYTAALRREAEAGPSASAKLSEARLATLKITNQLLRLQLEKIEDQFVTKRELAESWTKVSRIINAGMVSIPARFRQAIPHLTEHDERTIMHLVQDMLKDIASRSKRMVGTGGDTAEFGVLPDK